MKEYSVWIGEGALSQVGDRIATTCGGEAAAIITDDIVDKLYGDIAEQSLKNAGYSTFRFIFPHGERSKNIETYASLLNSLTKANLTRSDVVVALGGGVVGDMAGFVAATYLRGIRFVQIPTTLLAMVDSSVGGKTAVDLPAGKNLVGAFYQPDIVICDYETLKTLPEDIFRDGCAEMIKHGVIRSAELFELLKEPIRERMEEIIALNVTIKRDVVVMDEKENGIRRILNFGHTIGHGIEKHSNYSISHGEAVSIGMVITGRGAYRMGLCDENCYIEIINAVKRYNLPYDIDLTCEMLIEAAAFDKKRSGRRIALVLPERIGKCTVNDLTLDELDKFIRLGMRK